MCTVTIVPQVGGFRLVCNRDERLDRPRAVAPQLHWLSRQNAIYPVDPPSGGTWVGVNEAGLAAVLLNRSRHRRGRIRPVRSRGTIVPHALRLDSVREAVDFALSLEPGAYEPFTLVLIQRALVAAVNSDGHQTVLDARLLSSPAMFTSSSLGDAVVEGPRRWLFERMVLADPESWINNQRSFHRHFWRAAPQISVRMSRAEARTVSRTMVDVLPGSIRMLYEPLGARHTCARQAA